jgi:hypothetical protein
MAEKNIDLSLLAISPLSSKIKLQTTFLIDDPECNHLVSFLKESALLSQQEKKSRTFLAFYNDEIVAYITVSTAILKKGIEGIKNTTSFSQQALTLGKLYVHPTYRKN